jgi:hypothetical protein
MLMDAVLFAFGSIGARISVKSREIGILAPSLPRSGRLSGNGWNGSRKRSLR